MLVRSAGKIQVPGYSIFNARTIVMQQKWPRCKCVDKQLLGEMKIGERANTKSRNRCLASKISKEYLSKNSQTKTHSHPMRSFLSLFLVLFPLPPFHSSSPPGNICLSLQHTLYLSYPLSQWFHLRIIDSTYHSLSLPDSAYVASCSNLPPSIQSQ